MFEGYTEKARRAILFAHYEAGLSGSPEIETEHILLGLLREAHTVTRRFLGPEISQESIRAQVEAHAVKREETAPTAQFRFSSECERVLAYAAQEADGVRNKDIGPEHLLLGILREEKCYAARMLKQPGIDLESIRREIWLSAFQMQPWSGDGEAPATDPSAVDDWESTPQVERRYEPRTSFEGYTEKARRALFFARFEASQFKSSSIGIEHLLLGLLREGTAHLHLFGVPGSTFESIRHQIELHTPRGKDIPMSVDLPLSDECRRVLQFGTEEAQRLNRDLIGPEHMLMGILRERESFAAQLLSERGADLDEIRRILAEYAPAT